MVTTLGLALDVIGMAYRVEHLDRGYDDDIHVPSSMRLPTCGKRFGFVRFLGSSGHLAVVAGD